jgi:SAM-dependent methyltransferase
MIFGHDAATYDLARPGYPDEIFEYVTTRISGRDLLEIGAGSGKATVGFADGFRRITCLEPSVEMASILQHRNLPGVTVEVSTFEEWNPIPDCFDLVYAAQAWHWVDEATGFGRVLAVLKPGGVLALIWNVPTDRYGRFRDIYEEFAPEVLVEEDARIHKRDSPEWDSELEGAGFVDRDSFVHRWTTRLDAAGFVRLRSTYSDHLMMAEDRRNRLLDELERAVDDSGGWCDITYEARVFTGRKPGEPRNL